MPQSLADLIVHTVFSTKSREPFLRDKALREELHRYLGGVLNNIRCTPIIVGGAKDHVHLLCQLSRTCQPSEMVKEAKRASSLWLKTKGPEIQDFAWQGGYGMFSIGMTEVEIVRSYVGRQEEHHRKVTFQDELRQMFRERGMAFDERYVWD